MKLTDPPTSARHDTTPSLYSEHHIPPTLLRPDQPWRRERVWEFCWLRGVRRPWRHFWRGGRRLWRTWLLLCWILLWLPKTIMGDNDRNDGCEKERKMSKDSYFHTLEVPILPSICVYWFLCWKSRWASEFSCHIIREFDTKTTAYSWHQTYSYHYFISEQSYQVET